MLDKINEPYETIRFQTYHIFKDIKLDDFSNVSVMMIDDNVKDINLLIELLILSSNIKFTFTSFTNPYDALVYLETTGISPHLILLDLIMPNINGKIVLNLIKGLAKAKEIPVIVHSSMNNYENIMRTSALDAHAFFAKPLNVEALEDFLLNSL